MADLQQEYGFFNYDETVLESTGKYDREYTAEDFAKYFALFVGNGVFANPASQLMVKIAATKQTPYNVTVEPGWAFINGYWYHLQQKATLTIPVNTSAQTKYQRVVVRYNNTTREIGLAIVESAGETLSPTRNDAVYDLALAQITVKSNASVLSASDVKDLRPSSKYCGYVAGAVNQIDAGTLYDNLTEQFNEWFAGVKDQLQQDEAIKLQNQISELKHGEVAGGKNLFNGKYIQKLLEVGTDYTNINLYDEHSEINDITGIMYVIFGGYFKKGKYTLSYSNDAWFSFNRVAFAGTTCAALSKQIRKTYTWEQTQDGYTYFSIEADDSETGTTDVYFSSTPNIQIEEGTQATDYEPYIPSIAMLVEKSASDLKNTDDKIGNLASLLTTKKDSIVAAVNEIYNLVSANILEKTYPVGSVYMSFNETSPAKLFGGTWVEIGDENNEWFPLFTAVDNGGGFVSGSVGGEAEVKLTVNQIPRHSHDTGITTSAAEMPRKGLSSVAFEDDGAFANRLCVTGKITPTGYTGGSQAHNNMPPYIRVYAWRRTK